MDEYPSPGVGDPWMQRFAVSFEYPVYFTEDALDPADDSLCSAMRRLEPERRHRFLAVVDGGVARAWPDLSERLVAYAAARRLELSGPVRVVPGGEAAKNDPDIIAELQSDLHRLGVDRHSFVLIVGGGAVLDAAGYAAGTTHRGVRVIRMPTTVLSQCDGGVGVKTGANAFATKNFLGTFTPPFAVINDSAFLATLDRRDRIAGLSEAVKVALIRDAEFFAWLEANADALGDVVPGVESEAIRRTAELHLVHIAQSGDPFEAGMARPLDFGHWSAHKLEVMSGHRLRHGEAVAIGIALDCRYACEAGLLAPLDCDRIIAILERIGFRLWDDALSAKDESGRPAVLAGLDDFREHLGGELTLTIAERVGRARDIGDVDVERMTNAIDWLEVRAR